MPKKEISKELAKAIEKTIRNNSGKYDMWDLRIMLDGIVDNLMDSKKVIHDSNDRNREKKLVWIHDKKFTKFMVKKCIKV